MKENNGVKSTKNPERSNMEECDMCEKDVQNCRVGRDGSLDRNQKEDCSNTVGRESDEHNKETENQAEIKKHTETTEDNSNKIQPPTVDKEHSNISKVDKNIEHSEGKGEELHSHTKTDCNATTTETDGDRKAESYKDYGQEMYTHTNTEFKVTTKAEDGEKISKDYGQESYTHPDTDYKVTTTVTDDDKKEESSKDYHQEFYTHKKTDYKTTTPVTGGAMNTPERDEQVKAALAKARQFKTYDDEDEDTVYDYKKDKGDEQVKAALAKARQFKTYDDEDEDTVYDYKKDKGFIKACKKYVYFWRNKDIYSQWHKSVFTVNDKTFNCAEQYMMYKKAGRNICFYLQNSVFKRLNDSEKEITVFNPFSTKCMYLNSTSFNPLPQNQENVVTSIFYPFP